MQEKIRIILQIIVIFSSIIIPVASVSKNTPPTNLDQFVSNVSTLLHLTEGIIRQSRISHGFRKETSEYFNSAPDKFNAFFKLNPKEIANQVTNFYAAVQKLNLSANFEILENPVKMLKFLAQDSGNLEIQKSDIENYVKHLEGLKKINSTFEPPDFQILKGVQKCLIAKKNLMEIANCMSYMKRLDISKVEEKFKDLDKLLKELDPIQKLIEFFKKIEKLKLVVMAEYRFSEDQEFFKSLPLSLKDSEVALEGVESLMSENIKNIGKKLKVIVFGSKIKVNKEEREKMKQFSGIFDSPWLKEILGKENLEKLKLGFQPYLNYSIAIQEVEKIGIEFRDSQKVTKKIAEHIYNIEKWEEPYSIPDSLITVVEKCTQSLPNATLNYTEFMETWSFTHQFVTDFEYYILTLKQAKESKKVTIKGVKDLKANLEKWSMENWHQIQFSLDLYLRNNGSKNEKNLLDNMLTVSRVSFKYDMNIKNYKKNLSNHPNIKILGDTLEKVDMKKIETISKCLSDMNFQVGYVEETLEGADNLKRFKEKITEKDMDSMRSYMKGISEILKLLKTTRKMMKEGLSPETKELNGFSNAESIHEALGKGIKVIETMTGVQKNHELLQKALKFKFEYTDEFWENWKKNGTWKIEKTIQEVADLDFFVKENSKNLSSIGMIFRNASLIQGMSQVFEKFEVFKNDVNDLKEAKKVVKTLESIRNLDLDFTHHSADLHSASISSEVLKTFFDGFFAKKVVLENKETTRWKSINLPWFHIVLFSVGGLIFVILLVFIGCSCTKSGRRMWRRLYLERFASQETRELQWRYSFWLDQESDKNMLCEAVREVNFEQVKALIDKGVFVNVYNHFGNTPLHAAAKYGHVKIVEYLIRNGADRNAYNVENKTPEQLLAESVQTTTIRLMVTTVKSTTSVSEGATSNKSQMKEKKTFSQIEMIFEKLRRKTFRQKIPELLPTMSYRIRIDARLSDNISYGPFTEMYKGNVTDQMSGVTHFIVPTDSNGVFESDDFGYIMCVFLPTILMKQLWMLECTERGKKSAFRNDYKYRIERVKYHGAVYDTVVKWAAWIHKQCIPFLFGVHFHLAIDGMSQVERTQLRSLVEMHGAVWVEEMMGKENFNLGSHPYHHFNLGPLFVIHDGKKKNVTKLKNDADRMFTLMTFPEFVAFMLKLECHYDPERRVPIPVTNQVEDSDT